MEIKSKKLQIEVRLPNGKKERFSISSGKNWQTALKSQVQECYPRSDSVRFVEDLPKKQPSFGRPYKSGIMFEIRKNYYAHGQVIVDLAGK